MKTFEEASVDVIVAAAMVARHMVDHGKVELGTTQSAAFIKAISAWAGATGRDPYLELSGAPPKSATGGLTREDAVLAIIKDARNPRTSIASARRTVQACLALNLSKTEITKIMAAMDYCDTDGVPYRPDIKRIW